MSVVRWIGVWVALVAALGGISDAWGDEPVEYTIADAPRYDYYRDADWSVIDRLPNMIGDYFGGTGIGFQGTATIDRLFVVANDLDSPNPLPGGGTVLMITEPGPVGVFSSTVGSVQDIQQLLRTAAPLPAATQVGTIAENATVTTAINVGQIQALVTGTPDAFDVIPVAAPPGTYQAVVDQSFQARNTLAGTTQFNASNSGAILQGGADTFNGGEDLDAFYFYDYQVAVNVVSPAAGTGGLGRSKFAEGGSLVPRDRVMFDYGNYGNVITSGGVRLNRFVPGFEKTFLGGMASVEARFPFAANVATDIMTTGMGATNQGDAAFGDIGIYGKVLVLYRPTHLITAGLGVIVPTAEATSVTLTNGMPLLRVDNDAVYLQPFVACAWTPNDRFFAQSVLQLDLAANGNRVSVNTDGTGLTQAGRLTDANHLFWDVAFGYWLYQDNRRGATGITGVAPVVEFHYTEAITDADRVTAGPFQVGNFAGDLHMLNIVAGLQTTFGAGHNLSVAYTGPLTGEANRQVDGGLRLFYSRQFGAN
ncbi:MAG: hypothetical protein KDA62_00415 [Planctomycetales bacterium]|nr:hypothetical protein [Planctomycetales bacterium]